MGSLSVINKLYVWMATPLCRHTQHLWEVILHATLQGKLQRITCTCCTPDPRAPGGVTVLRISPTNADLNLTVCCSFPCDQGFCEHLHVMLSWVLLWSVSHLCLAISCGRVEYALCVQSIQQLMFSMCRLSVTVSRLDYSCLCSCNQLLKANLVRNHIESG